MGTEGDEVRPVITLKMRELATVERFAHLLKPVKCGDGRPRLSLPDYRWLA
jgi:hypothetical protein